MINCPVISQFSSKMMTREWEDHAYTRAQFVHIHGSISSNMDINRRSICLGVPWRAVYLNFESIKTTHLLCILDLMHCIHQSGNNHSDIDVKSEFNMQFTHICILLFTSFNLDYDKLQIAFRNNKIDSCSRRCGAFRTICMIIKIAGDMWNVTNLSSLLMNCLIVRRKL